MREGGELPAKERGPRQTPQGECSGLAAAPAPVPAGASLGYGKMARQHRRGGSRASQSERITGNKDPPGTTSCPKRRSRDSWSGRTPEDGLDGCGARNRAGRSRGVPAPIPGSVLSSLIHTHTTVAIDRLTGQHWRTGFDSDSMFLENYSVQGQGIIARWTGRQSHWSQGRMWPNSMSSSGVTTMSTCGAGRHRHGEEYWTGTSRTADFLAVGQARMRLLDNPDVVQIQNGRS